METYAPGDLLRFEIKLRDSSGIGYVAALFTRCNTTAHPANGIILLVGNGEGKRQANVELSMILTNENIPGEYGCEYLQVQDILGNHILHYPDISFRIQASSGTDHEGPELLDWRFKRE